MIILGTLLVLIHMVYLYHTQDLNNKPTPGFIVSNFSLLIGAAIITLGALGF